MITDPLIHLPLKGQRVSLTVLEEADLEILRPFFQDMASLTYYIPTTARPLNITQLREMISDWNDGLENFIFAIRYDNQLAGLVNLDDLDWPNSHAEIGIALTNKTLRGQGLAAEALSLLIDYSFNELGLHRLWARIIEDNAPSLRLFGKLGFQQEGLLRDHVRRRGHYRDMIQLSLLRQEWVALEHRDMTC
ncbi:MAG: GNAT family protein [Clostridiaceae bacterium]|nr:GNAT family protein [Clostridiaceae bacterium]